MAERFALIESGQPLLGAKRSCPNGSGRLALRAFEENSCRAGGRCRCAGRVAVYLPRAGRSRFADHDWDHALQGLATVRGVRFAPNATLLLRSSEMTLWAKTYRRGVAYGDVERRIAAN
jgi:hypothetical protein